MPLPLSYIGPRVILKHPHVEELSLPNRPVIFLDDGGVMNDNNVRQPQWQRMVSEFFAPILGGTPQAWADANHVVITTTLAPGAWEARMRAAPDYATFDYKYQLDWLYSMCELVGVSPPPEEDSVMLARRATASIIPRVRSAFPGAVEAIRLLHSRGYTLHTASGSPSIDLEGYLGAMGVRDCFGRLYGPDLIETFKNGPEFYERLLADAGVAPSDALVLDDSPKVVRWAEQAGARAVLVGDTSQASSERTTRRGVAPLRPYSEAVSSPSSESPDRINSLADLPALIEQLY